MGVDPYDSRFGGLGLRGVYDSPLIALHDGQFLHPIVKASLKLKPLNPKP